MKFLSELRFIRFLCTRQARIYSKSEMDSDGLSKTGLKLDPFKIAKMVPGKMILLLVVMMVAC